ncbi:MAG TPA: phosphoribosylglycinamide formyltransferase [Candidatus Paceibacterota bacterium]
MKKQEIKLAVLVSGVGTLLEAMCKAKLPIALVISDRECRGLEIAREAHIPTELVKRTDFTKSFDRVAFTLKTVDVLRKRKIDVIAMAGYMTVFSQEMFDAYGGRVLNTHPSLLPAFKGATAVADALKYGAKLTGFTVHIATKDLDAGPIIAQVSVPVEESDTAETLHERIKKEERLMYPKIIAEFINDLPPTKQVTSGIQL